MNRLSIGLAGLVCLVAAEQARPATFEPLGFLPGRSHSQAYDVSADGCVVVGRSGDGYSARAVRWIRNEEGEWCIGQILAEDYRSAAYGVSGEGSAVVGVAVPEPGPDFTHAFWWSESCGTIWLPDFPGGEYDCDAFDVSENGSLVAGHGEVDFDPGPRTATEVALWKIHVAECWVEDPQSLDDLPEGYTEGHGRALSAHGSVVVGDGSSDNGTEAFCWDGEMRALVDLPGGDYSSGARGLNRSATSRDNALIVGYGTSDAGEEACRWEYDGAEYVNIPLGSLPGGSCGFGVSADRRIIVGGELTPDSHSEAFIWDERERMRRLKDALEDDYGLDLTGWTLDCARAISDDGFTIVGYGTNPSGQTEAWRAVIPEPSTLALLAMASLGLMWYAWRCHRGTR